jgi:hypothetical protein
MVAFPIPSIFIAFVCPGSFVLPIRDPRLDFVFKSPNALFFVGLPSLAQSDAGMGLADLSVSTKLFKFS